MMHSKRLTAPKCDQVTRFAMHTAFLIAAHQYTAIQEYLPSIAIWVVYACLGDESAP